MRFGLTPAEIPHFEGEKTSSECFGSASPIAEPILIGVGEKFIDVFHVSRTRKHQCELCVATFFSEIMTRRKRFPQDSGSLLLENFLCARHQNSHGKQQLPKFGSVALNLDLDRFCSQPSVTELSKPSYRFTDFAILHYHFV